MGLSPGATALLAHLALHADKQGASWHSYASLGLRMGRSKGAVTLYMRELCKSGIVCAESLRCQNGSNWRVRACLAGWSPAKDKTGVAARKEAVASLVDAAHPISGQRGGKVETDLQLGGRPSSIPKAIRQSARFATDEAHTADAQTATVLAHPPATLSDNSQTDTAEPHTTGINASGDQLTERRAAKNAPDGVQPTAPYNKTNDSKTTLQTSGDVCAGRSTTSASLDAIEVVWKTYPDFDWIKVFGGDAAFISEKVLVAADAEAGERLDETQRLLDQVAAPNVMASRRALDGAITDLGLIAAPGVLDTIMASLVRLPDDAAVKDALDMFRKAWPKHWRKLDDARLITDACQSVLDADPAAKEIAAWRRRAANWRGVIERRARTRQRHAAAIAAIDARITAKTSACDETYEQVAPIQSAGHGHRGETTPTTQAPTTSVPATQVTATPISPAIASNERHDQSADIEKSRGSDEGALPARRCGRQNQPLQSMSDKERPRAAGVEKRRSPDPIAAARRAKRLTGHELVARRATSSLCEPQPEKSRSGPPCIVWPTEQAFRVVSAPIDPARAAPPLTATTGFFATSMATTSIVTARRGKEPAATRPKHARRDEPWMTSMYNNGASAPGGLV